MAKRATAGAASAGAKASGPRILVRAVGSLLAATVVVIAAVQTEEFLIEDPRFLLATPAAPGLRTGSFDTAGLFYTSESQVHEVFARDFGRSIYLCPVAERRRQLLGIDWVEEATVSRIWPNRIAVQVRERKPVAFVHVSARDGVMLPRLIDANGVILDARRRVRLKLPVLAGVRAGEPEALRRARVQQFLAFQAEAGELMNRISEVDVSDLDNIRVTQAMQGRILTLLLGNHDYRRRLDSLIANYPEIAKRMPEATVLDLRVPGRITAAPDSPAAETGRGGGQDGKS